MDSRLISIVQVQHCFALFQHTTRGVVDDFTNSHLDIHHLWRFSPATSYVHTSLKIEILTSDGILILQGVTESMARPVMGARLLTDGDL